MNKPLAWPTIFPPQRRPVILLSDFFNEELLLPYWIRHHAPMFDMAILIDYNSTDQSLDIIRREALKGWRVVRTPNKNFDAEMADKELMDYEAMYPKAWKIVLTTTEFLVHSNLRAMLAEAENNRSTMAFRFRSLIMTGNDSVPFKRNMPLLKQRSQYAYNPNQPNEKFGITIYSRYLHRYPFARYDIGRHNLRAMSWQWASVGFIAKYTYTPWPEVINRKLQIRARIPTSDFHRGLSFHHDITLDRLKHIKKKRRTMAAT